VFGMVAYEYMAVVGVTFTVEFVWELRLVWPHMRSKGIGKFHRPIMLTLLSTVVGLVQAFGEMVADFPKNRILGEAGVPPTVYNSTTSSATVTVPSFQGYCLLGVPLYDLSAGIIGYGIELPLFEYAAMGTVYCLLVEELAASKRHATIGSLQRIKFRNTALLVLLTLSLMLYYMTTTWWMPSYFLCGKRLNLHYDLAGHSIDSTESLEDYPFTPEDLNHNQQGKVLGLLLLLVLPIRPILWILFYRTVKELRGLVPTDSNSSNVVAMTRNVVRVGWIPFVLEIFSVFCDIVS
jgi:hypothetical protein